MVKVIKHEKAHFRIQIYDLKNKKSRTISLTNHAKKSVDDIKKMIIDCLEREN